MLQSLGVIMRSGFYSLLLSRVTRKDKLGRELVYLYEEMKVNRIVIWGFKVLEKLIAYTLHMNEIRYKQLCVTESY